MRVLPFGSVVTARFGRVWITAALSDGLICVHVAPPSVERQTPRAYERRVDDVRIRRVEHDVRTPRGEQRPPLFELREVADAVGRRWSSRRG